MISDRSLEFYQQLIQRRRDWQVIEPSPNQSILKGAEITISKALALSQLELPVGEWMTLELAKNPNLAPHLIDLLKLNIEDETKHDLVLNNLKAVCPPRKEDNDVVSDMVKRADQLANAYSPVTVAGVLESSVFFVILPIYRFLGGVGFRTIASDISNDEQIHVATNIQLAKDLGYNRGKALDTLRKDIIAWLTEDLPTQHENKYLSAEFWRSSSDSLYHQGKAANLGETKRALMPAFFEIASNNLPVYN